MKTLHHIDVDLDHDLVISGEDRSNEIGARIHVEEGKEIHLQSITISNIFIGVLKTGGGKVVFHGDLIISEFGGDAWNIRGSNIEFVDGACLRSYDNTPTRPYNTCYRKGNESIVESLARNSEHVYDTSLLEWEGCHDGIRQCIKGYHQDTGLQAFAVMDDGYTIDNDGVIENIIIPNIDIVSTGKMSQCIICSESCDIVNWQLGTKSLSIKSDYQYPLVFNTIRDSRIGNKNAEINGKVKILDVKPTKFNSSNVDIIGVDVVGYSDEDMTMTNIFDPIKEYPDISKMPRGYRNNNAGNIKDFGIGWHGLSSEEQRTEYQKAENVMCVFQHPKFGIRALSHDLQTKQRKYSQCKSIRGIIERYAPKGVDNNHTEEYIYFVAGRVGVGHKETISLKKHINMKNMVIAMMTFENGLRPPYGNEIIDEGLMLSGIVSDEEIKEIGVKKRTRSKGIRNGVIVGTGATGGVAAKVSDIIEKTSSIEAVNSAIKEATPDGAAVGDIVYSAPQVVTLYDWAVLCLLFVIAFAALDWVLDRRLTSLLGIK